MYVKGARKLHVSHVLPVAILGFEIEQITEALVGNKGPTCSS